ncbi:MAG: polysaccharide deacetylase family protein [Methylovulum sp.]|nr:polysaccharide deacetylase family protein [Methylovulum sp.]
MLNPPKNTIDLSGLKQPILCVVIDTEEEFNWKAPLRRDAISVKNIAHQEKAQRIFARYSIKPTYVIDYPVANQADGIQPLKAFYDDKLCDIGAHLHPWVTPPFTEIVNNRNSFPGNLSYEQEYEKLKILTQTIADNFGFSPTIYKAGRYGVGPNTTDILTKLGYAIDCSVVPHTNFNAIEGPDFSMLPLTPYWFAQDSLFEVPLSFNYVGFLSKSGNRLQSIITQQPLVKLRIPAIFSRLGLFERIRLSPEGHSFDELKRLTLSMLKQGHKVFCLTYHSSTLMLGGSPYVKNEIELEAFLKTIEQYCNFFASEISGTSVGLKQLKDNFRNG